MGTPPPATDAPDAEAVPPAPGGQRTRPLNWVALVAGVLITALGMALTAAGLFLLVAESSQRDGRYSFTEPEQFRTAGNAIVTAPFTVEVEDGSTAAEEMISVRLRATPVVPGQRVFVGMAPAAEAGDYLRDVPHAVVDPDPWPEEDGSDPAAREDGPDPATGLIETPGTKVPGVPGEQRIWEIAAVGSATQTLTVPPRSGTWVIVVMNDDGSRPVWVDLQVGVHTELFGLVNPGTLVTGLVGLLLGVPLVLLGAVGLGRDLDRSPPGANGAVPRGPDPLTLTGLPDPGLSRGMWLIKWLLAIPHYIVLGLLWFALWIVTIAAFFSILFTGRYPRSLFAFSVGVLRWSWRIGFYAYSALGTDRYPPFTLAPADHPAELAVTYPERLSRGLVLVKWWLLAIPHLMILGILVGGGAAVVEASSARGPSWAFSLLGLLVLIAAIGLLFTGRYPPGLFDLIVGLNRWVYRVGSYVLLLRDEYPPFRLDQGPTERTDVPTGGPADPTGPAAAAAESR